jgi:hypothetical protein
MEVARLQMRSLTHSAQGITGSDKELATISVNLVFTLHVPVLRKAPDTLV